jgi:soluble lytic murein transglycosylase-like protein
MVALGVTSPVQAERTAMSRSLVEEATSYEHGEGVPRDLLRAAVLYCQAARLGDAEAQYALGFMFANGRGVPRDDAVATGLFELATTQAYEPARRMLEHVRDPAPRLPECMREPAQTRARATDPAYAAFDGTYATEDDLIARLSPEKRRIAEIVRQVAAQHAISPRLALAVAVTESNLETAARSPKNAQGVMQLIPETAERFRVRNAFDPADNARGGVSYLRWLLAYYRGRVALAVAAYNAGEGAVDKYRGVPPYPETRDYVKRVMATYGEEEHPYDARIVDPSPAFSTAPALKRP